MLSMIPTFEIKFFRDQVDEVPAHLIKIAKVFIIKGKLIL